MKNDELPGEGNHISSRRYRQQTERFINSGKVHDEADFDDAEDMSDDRAAAEDDLLRDEEEAKSKLPR